MITPFPNNSDRAFPHTADMLQKIEDLMTLFDHTDDETFRKTTSDEEKMLLVNPMLHLAQAITMDDPIWAMELADYLITIAKHTHICSEDWGCDNEEMTNL